MRYAIEDGKVIEDPEGLTLGQLEEFILFEVLSFELKQELLDQIDSVRSSLIL